MDITEIQDELLRLEYPNLLPDHDPDIERYYYLRSTGHSGDALAIYKYRLRPRYPDDEFRTWLLRSYRSHDPAFRGLLTKGYRMLGQRSLDRIKNIILFIAEKAESFNEKDVYSTIKTAEDILRVLPQERYEAVAGIDRFYRYAAALNLKERSIARASELVRAYLTDTLSVVETERRRRSEAERRVSEQERQRLVKADYDSYFFQKKFGYRPHLIDLSSVVFSETDIARIEIPPFRRIEDQVLAYCIKYWNMVSDPAFERILFLYSRKFGRKNYDVFTAIRRGRMAKRRDDEILASIVSVLITGYYYSIQGDIYLQRSWNAIKNALQNQAQSRLALPPPPQTRPAGKTALPGAKTAPSGAKAAGPKIAPRAKPKNTPRIAPKAKPVPKTAVVVKPVRQPAALKPFVRPKPIPVRGVSVPPPVVKVPAGLKPAREQKTTVVSRPAQAARPAQPARPAQAAQPARPVVRPAPAPVTQRPVQSARPVQAAQPARPVQPVKVAQPVSRSAPVTQQPVRPAQAAQAAKPVQPVTRPTPVPVIQRPVQPARPAQSAQPARPVQPVKVAQPVPRPAQSAQPVRPAQAAQAAKPVQPVTRPAPAPVTQRPVQPARPAQSAQPARPVQPVKVAQPVARPTPAPVTQRPVQPARPVVQPVRPTQSAKPAQPLFAPLVPASPPPKPRKQKVFSTSLEKARGSVSDRLKELSGRSYDVYEDRFLARTRNAIRRVLGAGKGLFFNLPEEAEDLVFGFLRDNYSNPYMNWEDSAERKNLLSMGFDLPSIVPVIDECYRNL